MFSSLTVDTVAIGLTEKEWEGGLKVQKGRGWNSVELDNRFQHNWIEGISSVYCGLLCILRWTSRAPRPWAAVTRRGPRWLSLFDPYVPCHILEFYLAPHIHVWLCDLQEKSKAMITIKRKSRREMGCWSRSSAQAEGPQNGKDRGNGGSRQPARWRRGQEVGQGQPGFWS